MAQIVHDCSHCGATDIAQVIHGQCYGPRSNYVLCMCPRCTHPSVYELANDAGEQLGDIVRVPYFTPEIGGYRIVDVWPKPPEPNLPGGLPKQVARAFMQAEDNFLREGMEEVAAGAYGRALDVGTKLIAPDFKGMLYARIKHLAETGRITADLADWAHEIRSIRNDALHEVDGIDRHELTAIRGLADMVLRYLFTLPEMVKARKAEAKAA